MKIEKIAVIMQSPDFGGAESFMISLVNEFDKNKVEVILFTNKGKYLRKAKQLGINVYQLPFVLDFMGNKRGLLKFILFFPFYFSYYLYLISKIKNQKCQLILMSGFSEKLMVSVASLIIKIPVVWIEYGPLKKVFRRNFGIPGFIYRKSSFIPKNVIVPTKYTMNDLLIRANINKSKIITIPCGISKPARIVKKQNKVFTIGSVSRITEEKGQEYLIRSAVRLRKNIPNFRALIVGDGPDLNRYRNLVKELNLENNVVFTGFVKDTSQFYSEFDVFAFTSIWDMEGFGLVSVEAMYNKVPVVAFKNGPVENIIQDRVNGLLVKSKDLDELSNAIITLYKNKKLKDKIIDNAFSIVKEKYDIKVVAKQYLLVFQNVI